MVIGLLLSGIVAEAADPCLDCMNHCGKPCLRLNPPGGSLSWSEALTVSVSEALVVYVYVVKGVSNGWNISEENVINGAESGNRCGNDIWNLKIAGAYGPDHFSFRLCY